jgi:Ser/Thr protein kinase RdoA (MazF antagonist)
MSAESFFDRVNFQGDPNDLVQKICDDYRLGEPASFSVPAMGYEDLNIALKTPRGPRFAKLFASSRTKKESRRIVGSIEKALNAGVIHPRIFVDHTGHPLHAVTGFGDPIWMVLMDYVDGGTVLESGKPLQGVERQRIIQQAALINSLDYYPARIHDSWAVVNLPAEFKHKREALTPSEDMVIKRVLDRFTQVPKKLPRAFVHGDIRSSNVMRSNNGNLYIIDFAVSNRQPRIVELAVLLTDLFYDLKNPISTYEWVVTEYQKHQKLTEEELDCLPIFIQASHAMNVLGAQYERAQGNTLNENNEWLRLGRLGLGID